LNEVPAGVVQVRGYVSKQTGASQPRTTLVLRKPGAQLATGLTNSRAQVMLP
jgi:hypothetical protein